MTNVIEMPNELKLNPFFRIRFGKKIHIDLLLQGETYVMPDVRILSALASISNTQSISAIRETFANILEVDVDTALDVILNLYESNIFQDASIANPQEKAVAHWIDRGWLEALVMHLCTRNLPYLDRESEDPIKQQREMLSDLIKKEPIPDFWKIYSDKKYIALPSPNVLPEEPMEQLLLRRRSNQPWKKKQIDQNELSTILHFANIETRRLRKEAEQYLENQPERLFNSSFSALESYFFAFNVSGLEPGIYHYDPLDHRVALIRHGDLCDELIQMCIGQERIRGCACAFVISAIWLRYMYRYRHPRAYRTLMINTAELAQKYILLGTAFHFSTFLTPAFEDDYANRIMGMNGYEEAPLYVVAIG
ncbi:SagB/ThcOx family dehydrogenase [Xenorhabdus griffiniae]|uniref:SagB/ThcOx family dehydrogenase n=2 Tax=Xenorhabdus TaxID=626 RepID=A0ABY9XF34_9GAMM|nr:SagB/ThcOx family dehydrogenase [Xenorhabdus griffiniae]MBD1228894.1 SagB/ThcOx family dehydrogenase [Xenorhabdus griffiniae]MBE8588566.1 SagB/ThcOx family dehydrogenase [Xenorhabdus griffiniae]WMV71533.1 SagB/ThcOx family dehydrogenase [Xenorhabdus griffiniae]WNH01210.1 SagB/ThcOx family dehydrogenase [Xenorhabdus griffiniae]